MQPWQHALLMAGLSYVGIHLAATLVNTVLYAVPSQKMEDWLKTNTKTRLFVLMCSSVGFDISDTIDAFQVWLNHKADVAVPPRLSPPAAPTPPA